MKDQLILMRTSVSYTIYIIFLYSNILKENKIDAMLPFEIFFASRLKKLNKILIIQAVPGTFTPLKWPFFTS
jgi:hypothetical protein